MLILSKPLRFLRKHLPYPRYRAAEEDIATHQPHSHGKHAYPQTHKGERCYAPTAAQTSQRVCQLHRHLNSQPSTICCYRQCLKAREASGKAEEKSKQGCTHQAHIPALHSERIRMSLPKLNLSNGYFLAFYDVDAGIESVEPRDVQHFAALLRQCRMLDGRIMGFISVSRHCCRDIIAFNIQVMEKPRVSPRTENDREGNFLQSRRISKHPCVVKAEHQHPVRINALDLQIRIRTPIILPIMVKGIQYAKC